MKDLFEQLLGVLLDGDVHFHLECERTAVGVPWVCVVLGRRFGEPPGLALALDLVQDRNKALALCAELLAQSIEGRLRQFPSHWPSNLRPGA